MAHQKRNSFSKNYEIENLWFHITPFSEDNHKSEQVFFRIDFITHFSNALALTDALTKNFVVAALDEADTATFANRLHRHGNEGESNIALLAKKSMLNNIYLSETCEFKNETK